jgi:hypothetical protein
MRNRCVKSGPGDTKFSLWGLLSGGIDQMVTSIAQGSVFDYVG